MQSMLNSPKTPNTKRNRLSNKEKVDMIKFMEINNLTATQMCEKFSLAPSTLSGKLLNNVLVDFNDYVNMDNELEYAERVDDASIVDSIMNTNQV